MRFAKVRLPWQLADSTYSPCSSHSIRKYLTIASSTEEGRFLYMLISILPHIGCMGKRARRKPAMAESTREFLEEYPKPPEEHAYERRMEKKLKRMLTDEEKKQS